MLSYDKIFKPKATSIFKSRSRAKTAPEADNYAADRRDGLVYVYNDDIVLAVNVALTVKRPLLIRGASGSGKSSLAQNVARFFKWRYYEVVISSGTQARDLLWQFDTLRRLSDAQAKAEGGGVKDDVHYIEPGALWWAFDPESAKRRGVNDNKLKQILSQIPEDEFYAVDPNKGDNHSRAVVLLDEIDKADPDTPNNLLVPLGSLEFTVTDVNAKITAKEPPLVIITSNDERDLPSAFLRRCIMLNLQSPGPERLVAIAQAHFGKENVKLYQEVADLMIPKKNGDSTQPTTETNTTESKPQQSAAEFLDTVHACLKLKVKPDAKDKTWQALSKATLWKPRESTGAV
jgi:MoxR-like ATPase